ncbi:MAG TPA: GNAT family protein [Candidatus Baltobacteraceae bacterium]|nr:GNAT family protein [Candidatus Baltobacteraceae bacterium]
MSAFDPARVELRRVAEGDLPLLLAWRNAERVRVRMFTRETISAEQHRAWWARRFADPAYAQYLLRYDARPLGTISFATTSEGSAECGYFVGPDDAPRGSGTLLLLGGLARAFGELRLRRVCCDIYDDNEPSLRLVRRFAFAECARRRPDARRFVLAADGFVAAVPRVRALLFAEPAHALR